MTGYRRGRRKNASRSPSPRIRVEISPSNRRASNAGSNSHKPNDYISYRPTPKPNNSACRRRQQCSRRSYRRAHSPPINPNVLARPRLLRKQNNGNRRNSGDSRRDNSHRHPRQVPDAVRHRLTPSRRYHGDRTLGTRHRNPRHANDSQRTMNRQTTNRTRRHSQARRPKPQLPTGSRRRPSTRPYRRRRHQGVPLQRNCL